MSLVSLTSGNPMRVVVLSVLIFEVIVFGLAVPVMILVSQVPAGLAVGFGGGAAALALIAASLLRTPHGYAIGWLTQLVGVGLGVLTSTMFVVGGIFFAIWVLCFVLGKKLDTRSAPD